MFTDSILFNKLKELDKKEETKKAELIERVYEKFKDYIEAITKLFSDFTDHSISHCVSVIKILEELVIGEDLLKKSEWKKEKGVWRLYLTEKAYLTEDEIVLLFLAILLHDIGMSPRIDSRLKELLEKAKLGKADKHEIEEIKRIVREEHHIRSRRFVESDSDLKDILKEHRFGKYIQALAEIVEGHRIDPYDLFDKFGKVYDVRVPLLAFLLEIADDMDIGSHRVDKFISEDWIWIYLKEENIEHILANMSVERFYRENYRVEYEVVIEDLDRYNIILELVYKWWDKIENRIDRFRTLGILSEREDLDAWRYVLPSRVDFRFKVEGVDADCSRKFGVDRRLFADLLSDRVYGGEWTYAFRELIANAFDAIKRRAYEEDFDNPKVEIVINFKEDWTEIVIEDNGIGMSMRDVEDYLLRVGRSFYQELREKEPGMAKAISPAGYYGIGFLSSFMLLKSGDDFEGSIEIETKRRDCDAVKVVILNPNLPIVKLKSSREDIGTRIKILCKRKDVREFFERIVEFAEQNKIRIFPFRGIINSAFEVKGKKLEIAVKVKINGHDIWNEPVKPDLFIDGEKLIEIKVKEDENVYKFEIWRGLGYLTDLGLTPVKNLDVSNANVTKTEKLRELVSVNGLSCSLSKLNYLFKVFEKCKVNGREITFVLNVESSQPNFTDLKKDVVELDRKVMGKIFNTNFNELSRKEIYFDMCYLYPPSLYGVQISVPKSYFEYFVEIGAENFAKNCLRFKTLDGKWMTLEEIEKIGKKPLVSIEFIEINYNYLKEFFEKEGYCLLSSDYSSLFEYDALDEFFERCNECDNCIFGFYNRYKVKHSKFKEELSKLGHVIAIMAGDQDNIIVDSPFIKTICKLWKESLFKDDNLKKNVGLIVGYITLLVMQNRNGYTTLQELEKYIKEFQQDKEALEFINIVKSHMND